MNSDNTYSQPSLYSEFYTDKGEKLLVLKGLSVDDVYNPPLLQQYIHPYYVEIQTFYYLLFFITLIYMIGVHIVLPLINMKQTKV